MGLKSKVRMIECRWGFARLYPNPGIDVNLGFFELHWCRKHGFHWGGW